MMSASITLSERVNVLMLDCGLATQSTQENIVSRGRRLASYFGFQFASVSAVVEEAELLVYGSVKSANAAPNSAAAESSKEQGKADGIATTTLDHADAGRTTESKEANDKVASGELHGSIGNIVLLYFLPWICQCIWGYSYSSVALHYRSTGWPMWRLSIISWSANVTRPVLNGQITKAGPWISAPLSCLALMLIFPGFVWPDWELTVSIQLFVGYFMMLELCLSTMCFSKFSHSQELVEQASRIQNLAFTVGYAMSPAIGGVVYDLWGWRGASGMHVVAQGLMCICLCASSDVWKDYKRWKEAKQSPTPKTKGSSVSNAFPILLIPKAIRWPCVAVGLSLGACCYTYSTEWNTYALFFREEHNWTSAMWAGICQMSGDVLGAIVMVLAAKVQKCITSEGHSEDGTQETKSRCLLFSKPYNITWALLAFMTLSLGLASHSLQIAVASQTLMGTVYVFFFQWVNEMNMLYSFGDSEAYARIRTFTLVFLTSFHSTASGSSLLLYDNVSRRAPFYVAAAICCVAMTFYTIIFFVRVGCTGNLKSFEQKHAPVECTVISVAPAGSNE
eukprot:gnl/MRDRNA2_/MRDRNA2_72581_c0_seq1.p1 gnl/MRDRNA2_/MRDRNA2_72581_c0~~gnl/MRDRNA2_/MRDRNA2_72581_c0_seq1.p1  ORF type:complete len:564 (+),score=63.78 gnl/MRDRNA2_/MRDRNA2_72581_c0_seq1:147-1838(+)